MALAPVAWVRVKRCVGGGGDTQAAMASAMPCPDTGGQEAAVRQAPAEVSVPSGAEVKVW